jgi:Fe-S-cluster containining protein
MFKCLRCGYCCLAFQVPIIKDPEGSLNKKNTKIKWGGIPCPYLTGDKPGEHGCAMHDKPWYKYTVCYRYNQNEPECILGYYYMKQQGERQ